MKNVFLLIGILFIIMLILDSFIYHHVYSKGEPINHIVLPDIIHDNIPKIQKKVSDNFTNFISVIFIIFFTYHRQWNYILLWVILFIITRFITNLYFISTILPDSSKSCKYSANFFETATNMGSCNCLNISGHMLNVILILYLIYNYLHKRYTPVFILAYLIAFFLICASRNHYTVDCITSTVIALLVITQLKNLVKFLNYITGTQFFSIN